MSAKDSITYYILQSLGLVSLFLPVTTYQKLPHRSLPFGQEQNCFTYHERFIVNV